MSNIGLLYAHVNRLILVLSVTVLYTSRIQKISNNINSQLSQHGKVLNLNIMTSKIFAVTYLLLKFSVLHFSQISCTSVTASCTLLWLQLINSWQTFY